ncbi:MAG: hypothetical protein CMB99_04380 [Flavobacteriaceae bacterium]|nr:hypothetical protein [Flavobacteriaceae bacterium]|tara:strand:+ start:62821 stop:63855 length:1035 start_codon:yes stop_codon:yes gene_type:complete
MKKYILLTALLFSSVFSVKAQDGFENILLADVADSQKLLQAYFAPGMEGFINSMNNGWAHTAKVHKTLGFDISIGVSASAIPSERELFNIGALGLTSVSSTSSTASTFGGPNNTTMMTVNTTINGQAVSANFEMPGGVKDDLPLNAVPAPVAQITVGLPWKMDAMVRFVPKLNIGEDDGSVEMLGLGLKKEITSWFGPLEKTPLHVSLLAAYTTMDVNYAIEDQTGDFSVQNAATSFSLNAFTVQALASLNFPIFNVYGGIGYNSGSASYDMTGTFTGTYQTGLPAPNDTVTRQLGVPRNLDFDASGFRTTVGARLSLGFFKIFADYTLQNFNSITAGVAFSFR